MLRVSPANLRHRGQRLHTKFYHAGVASRFARARLSGRQWDRNNSPFAPKATEDAVTMMPGADADLRWRPEWEPEPGGTVGVAVGPKAIAT